MKERVVQNHRVAWREQQWNHAYMQLLTHEYVEDFATETGAQARWAELTARSDVLEIHVYDFPVLTTDEEEPDAA